MMTQVDFYQHLSEHRESRVIVVYYSSTYDRFSMASALAIQKNFSSRRNLFVTRNKEKLKDHHAFPASILTDDFFYEYPDDEIPDKLVAALGSSTHIFIDDAHQFVESMITRNFVDLNAISARVFVLVSETDAPDVVGQIFKHYPKALRINAELVRQELKVNHRLHCSIAQPRQLEGYRAKREWEKSVIQRVTETENPTDRDLDRKLRAEYHKYSQQYLNLVYPLDIQHAYDFASRKVGYTIPEDVDFSKGGWMTRALMSQLPITSPKMVQLISSIRLNDNVKHLVYSDYVDHHGLQYIQTILSYMSISSQILTIEDDSSQINDVMVYLTNDQKFDHYQFANIYHLHIFDSIDVNGLYQSIYQIISRRNYELVTGPVTVHYYVSDLPDGSQSIDRILYDEMLKVQERFENYHQTARNRALNLQVYEDMGLVYYQ